MRVALRCVCAVPLSSLLALGVVACGSSSSTSTTTTTASATAAALVGTSTTVALTPETAEALKRDEVTVSAVAPATVHTTWVLPVTGGHVVASTLTGTIEDSGELVFIHAGHSVHMRSFIVDTTNRQMTAVLAGVRRTIFELNLSFLTHATGTNGTLFGRDIALTLTSQASTTLNSALGVSTFKAGEHFGTITLTLAVRR
jgi:dihydroorotase-like cyclic amidohydrolase